VGRDNYNWLYWTWVTRLLNKTTDGEIPPGAPQMETVDAVSGRLRNPAHQAANDMAARLVVLAALLWITCYAKTGANFPRPARFSHQLTRGEILEAIPLYPAWLRLFPVLMALDGLCHNDHSLTLIREIVLTSINESNIIR